MKSENTPKEYDLSTKICFFSLLGVFTIIPPLALLLLFFVLIHYGIVAIEQSFVKSNLGVPSED